MIPNALLLEKKELEERLQWIDSEITQLSNSKGVGERIQGLKYARAQLIATLDIRKIMYKDDE
jgi:flagellar biosynthesis/type III secretory pathway chaperone